MRFKVTNPAVIVLALCVTGGLTAKADSVQDPGGTWQTWTPSQLADNPGATLGTPYWNHESGDGLKYNVGWCLVGGGNCSIPNAPHTALPSLSNAGAAPSSFYFMNSGAPNGATLLVSLTSNQANDTFGWYPIVGGVPMTSPLDLHQLFVGTQDGTTAEFTPTATYGFYIKDQLGTWFTQTSADSTPDGFQAFALFDQNAAKGDYYLGVEDGGASRDKDYQDMIFHLSQVPEPASVALIGSGLLFVGALIRRRKANS